MFWCMFVQGFCPLDCNAMQSQEMTYVLYMKEIYDSFRESATHCKMPKSGLKTRRRRLHGGLIPPRHQSSQIHCCVYFGGAFFGAPVSYMAERVARRPRDEAHVQGHPTSLRAASWLDGACCGHILL